MKKVLITGANSYIGTSLEKWLQQSEEQYHVDTLDMIDPNWKTFDFSPYDSIFHVAAIVHKNEKQMNSDLYEKVNTKLPIELATIAKHSGLRQFIFLSSMSVYGNDTEEITRETRENPSSYYGKSKLAAEIVLKYLFYARQWFMDHRQQVITVDYQSYQSLRQFFPKLLINEA